MDCRQFRKQHALFIDDLLSGVKTWAMRDHLSECASCSRLDSQLRRALLVARNAPALQPSAQFQRKLAARLAQERASHLTLVTAPRWGRSARATVAGFVLATAAAAAVVAVSVPQAPPTVAAATAADTSSSVAPPVSPAANTVELAPAAEVYPAMLLAQRATEQFVASRARALSGQASH